MSVEDEDETEREKLINESNDTEDVDSFELLDHLIFAKMNVKKGSSEKNSGFKSDKSNSNVILTEDLLLKDIDDNDDDESSRNSDIFSSSGFNTCEALNESLFEEENKELIELRLEMSKLSVINSQLRKELNLKDSELAKIRSELKDWIKLTEDRSLEVLNTLSISTTSKTKPTSSTSAADKLRLDLQLLVNDYKYLKQHLSKESDDKIKLLNCYEELKLSSLKETNLLSLKMSDLKNQNKILLRKVKRNLRDTKKVENELNDDILFLSNEIIKYKNETSYQQSLLEKKEKENENLLTAMKKNENEHKELLTQKENEVKVLVQENKTLNNKIAAFNQEEARANDDAAEKEKKIHELENLLGKCKQEFTEYVNNLKSEYESRIKKLSQSAETEIDMLKVESKRLKQFECEIAELLVQAKDETISSAPLLEDSNTKGKESMDENIQKLKAVLESNNTLNSKHKNLKQEYHHYISVCEKKLTDIQSKNKYNLRVLETEIRKFKQKLADKEEEERLKERKYLLLQQDETQKIKDLELEIKTLKMELNESKLKEHQQREEYERGLSLKNKQEEDSLIRLDNQVNISIEELKKEFTSVQQELLDLKQRHSKPRTKPKVIKYNEHKERDKDIEEETRSIGIGANRTRNKTSTKDANSKKVLNSIYKYLKKHKEGIRKEEIENILNKVDSLVKPSHLIDMT